MSSTIALLCLFGCAFAVRVDWQNPTAFEGDIGLDPETRSIVNSNLNEQQYKGVTGGRIWDDGVIPYAFGSGFDQFRRQKVAQAMQTFAAKTCIKFRPRNGERDYVKLVVENMCWSIIGKGGGPQKLKLGNFCLDQGTILHELMHAAGFYHEQSRNDRDDHVNIFWNNIQSGQSYNFQKYRTHYYGQGYDLQSIMHYRNTEFSANGRNTIEAKSNRNIRLGNKMFSASDIRAIAAMYNCKGTNGGLSTPPPSPSCMDRDSNCGPWAKQGYCKNYKHGKWMYDNCKKSCRHC